MASVAHLLSGALLAIFVDQVTTKAYGEVWLTFEGCLYTSRTDQNWTSRAFIRGYDLCLRCEVADAIVSDWWALDDELSLRFGDGWEHEWAAHSSVTLHLHTTNLQTTSPHTKY